MLAKIHAKTTSIGNSNETFTSIMWVHAIMTSTMDGGRGFKNEAKLDMGEGDVKKIWGSIFLTEIFSNCVHRIEDVQLNARKMLNSGHTKINLIAL